MQDVCDAGRGAADVTLPNAQAIRGGAPTLVNLAGQHLESAFSAGSPEVPGGSRSDIRITAVRAAAI